MWTDADPRLPQEGVSATTLRALAAGFRSGQLACPLTAFAISRVTACPSELSEALVRLSGEGMAARHLALLLQTAGDAAEARLAGRGAVELVWTGPEGVVSHSRDTETVVAELFGSARRSVLVSTFAIQGGERLFAPLAARADLIPGLAVRLFVHIARAWKDTRDDSELLREFSDLMRRMWPGRRPPEVYYDPRGLTGDDRVRASWHAKCVVVDDEVSFVTSANFTEWAQQRNVEAGVLIRGRDFARQLAAQFDGLVNARLVRRLPGF